MRTIIFRQRVTPSIFFIFILFNSSFGQVATKDSIFSTTGGRPTNITCGLSTGFCNRISNNTFTSSCFGNTPFSNCITNWTYSHGSPQLNVYGPLIGASINHASMWAAISDVNGTYISEGEGIATGIQSTTPGRMYNLSFLEKVTPYIGNRYVLDDYYFVLLKCNDFNALKTTSYSIPNIPANAQVIYNGHNTTNSSWETKQNCFTANDAYDVLWIFPKQTGVGQNNISAAFLEIGTPELVDMEGAALNVGSVITSPDCNYLIGPATSTPSCAVTSAVFTWHGPNSNSIPNNPVVPYNNQQITVDASNPNNVGIWTLEMTLPFAPTNNCTALQGTLNVAQCGCPIPTQILTSSYFDPLCNNPHLPVIPYTLNYYCVPWECGGSTNLLSNYGSGNQWYVNDFLIPGNGGDFPGIGQVLLTNNSQKLYHVLSSSSSNNQLFKFQLKNNTQGCEQLTIPTYVYYGETFFPAQLIGEYKANYTLAVSTPLNYSAGPGAIYTWSIPGTVVTDIDNTTPQASVYFPNNIPTPTVSGTLTVTNSAYCNGSYNIYFTYNPNAFSRIPANTENKNQTDTRIYPNPATSQIAITSSDAISYIEISDFMNPTLKRVRVNSSKSIQINVRDLKPGVYTCKIVTDKGMENQRLIIRRE